MRPSGLGYRAGLASGCGNGRVVHANGGRKPERVHGGDRDPLAVRSQHAAWRAARGRRPPGQSGRKMRKNSRSEGIVI